MVLKGRVPANPAGAAAIVRKKNPNPANPPQSITNPKKPPLPKAERIIPVAGMEHGFNRIITEPAVVPAIPVGAERIVRKTNEMYAVNTDTGL